MADETRLAKLRQLVELDSEDSFSRYAMAMELKGLDRRPEALSELTSLLESAPDYLATYYQCGRLLQEEGQEERAVEVVTQGIAIAVGQSDDHAKSELQDLLDELG